MIDLPDHGYMSASVSIIDAGGSIAGTLGGPTDYIPRPGVRYMVTYSIRLLRSRDLARIFAHRLEQGLHEDVSYPWPLDFRPPSAGIPVVSASSPAGDTIPISGLVPGYGFREGQPVAVISGGVGFVHKVAEPTVASGTGTVSIPVQPWTRATFAAGSVVEIEKPRIRGTLDFDGSEQPAFGSRPFQFSVSERI